MGCYKEDGDYFYSLITSVSEMAKFQDKEYCVICDVSDFYLVERNEENERVRSEKGPVFDRWYNKDDVEFVLEGLSEKFFGQEEDRNKKGKKGIWRQYDKSGKLTNIISRRKTDKNIEQKGETVYSS